jgi:hypothetical protein
MSGGIMETTTFQERVKRLKEVNEVIEKLDPAIREEAFSLLAGYVTGQPYKRVGINDPATDFSEEGGESVRLAEELFARYPDGKPSDNVVLTAAFLYSQYGAQPFKLDEIRAIAESVGLTIPTSLDMTLRQAKRDGKSLFQHTGRSEFKPTVHGELYLKKTYQVAKGTKKRPLQGDES